MEFYYLYGCFVQIIIIIDVKPGFVCQIRHQNEIFLLSRFLAKTMGVNKPAMKMVLKNLSFEVQVKL